MPEIGVVVRLPRQVVVEVAFSVDTNDDGWFDEEGDIDRLLAVQEAELVYDEFMAELLEDYEQTGTFRLIELERAGIPAVSLRRVDADGA